MNKKAKDRLEKNIKRLYWISFIKSSGFHLVVFTLFLLSKGFTMSQFFLIQSAYYLVSLLMEIPTGIFSDLKSKKNSLIIASVIGIPVTLMIISSNSFWVVLIAMAIAGISSALVSGTDVAILYDTLKSLNKEKEFKKIQGKMKWYGSWSGAIGGILGGFLAQFKLSYPWWITFFMIIPALIIKIKLVEPPFHKEIKKTSYVTHFKESLKISFKGDASYFVIYSAVVWTFFVLSFFLWQPFLELTTLPFMFFGVFYAVERLISGYSSKVAHRVELKMGMRNSLLLIPLVLALALILESQIIFIFGFLIIFLQSVVSGFFLPVLDDYLNVRIPSSKRSTIFSIKNMVHSLLYILISPLLGHLIDLYSLQTGLLLMGGLLVVISIVFFILYKKPTKELN